MNNSEYFPNINPEKDAKMPSETLIADIPSQFFSNKFPGISEKYGEAVQEEKNKDGKPVVRDIGEDFFAACLGAEGMPETPTVYMPAEDRFYTYIPNQGIYGETREAELSAKLSQLLLECARACKEGTDTKKLEFNLRDSASLVGIIKRAKGLLAVPVDYFADESCKFITCNNGVLRIEDKKLLPFSPKFRRRNKLSVNFDCSAKCPLFLEQLMRPALSEEDLSLLQTWCGLALLGINYAQKLIILSGTAGGGKGTFIRVLHGIIGSNNIGSLRTQQLGERFEIGRFLNKTLLYGADVPENFLNCRGASVLKALTGGDPVTIELKGSNERPEILCKFNIIVTCNSRLTVHLEGDTDAWRRRLVILEYRNKPPQCKIADFSERILREEGSGVLNWMLEGMDRLRAEAWQLPMNGNQQKAVDDLLLESNSHLVFFQNCLGREEAGVLTVDDCFTAYSKFCFEKGWRTMAKNRFGHLIPDLINREFGICQRHDIVTGDSKRSRGWRGIVLI